MNEEDIEKVEKLIKKCDECKLYECINCEINWTEIASVRRLIDGYKQLKEYYKEQNEVNEKFIPKSKIKEKIEELKQEYKIELEKNSIKAFILKCKIEALEELLQEGK